MLATDFFETSILNLARGISITAPQTMYLALFLNNPSDAGGGTEVDYTGYARMPITFSVPAPVTQGIGIENADTITFAKATQDVGDVTHVGVLDSATGGNMYVYNALSEPLKVQTNIAPVVRAGSLKWYSTGKMSNAYKTKELNILRGIDCAGFTPYLALYNGSPESGGAEFSGNAYERMAVEFSAPGETSSGASIISNATEIMSATATGTWGNLTHVAIYDAASNGTPFFIDTANPATQMTKDKAVRYDTGALKISLN